MICKTANQYMTVSKKKNIEVARIKLEHSVAISDFCRRYKIKFGAKTVF